MRIFSLELVLHQHRRSTDLLEKCVRQRRQNDPKDWWQAKKEQFWTQNADCSFKLKRETARTLKIYFEKVSDRGNETIVETTGRFGQQKVDYLKRETASTHSAATMLPDPFSRAFRGLGHETSLVEIDRDVCG